MAYDDQGDFKKGRFNPAVIGVGVAAVIGFVVFMFMGAKQESGHLTVEQAEQKKREIFVLPKAEQMNQWRTAAVAEVNHDELQSEAMKQLAWAKDPEGVKLCIQGLSSLSDAVKGMAASALAEYGRPMGEPARDALLAALKTSSPATRPQIGWALTVLGETRAFDDIMQLYRLGHLSQVERLGGGNAFDPQKIVDLVSLDKLASMAGDESAAVRQLVASVLSRDADPKWTDALIKLLGDPDKEISRQAAPGLGKIGDQKARGPLLEALKGGDTETRKKFLYALRDGIGAEGLVLALESVDPDVKKGWFQTKQIFEILEKLADPRAGDALALYLKKDPHIHWQWRAAVAMAQVGDARGIPVLARRLRMDPLKIYSDLYDHEMILKRDDNERVVAARMIADLAMLHPDKVKEIQKQAEDSLIFWIHELPSPHANGLRALAAMKSTKDLTALRDWANPDSPLPKEGQQPPMPEEWVIAQSALRYVGWLKDDNSWGVMEKNLRRRPKEQDVTMEGLMQGGLAILGMTLRAIGVGAAEGMSEWSDNRAFKPLLEHVEDVKNNEQSRMAACAALAWTATKDDFLEIAKKIEEYSGPEKSDQFRRACLLETLIQRPVPGTASALLKLMTPESALETRHQVARAIAKGGFDQSVEAELVKMMDNEALLNDAALALVLGGSPDTAARTVARYSEKPPEALEELGRLWYGSFGYWSHDDFESGVIYKYVENAEAIRRLEVRQTQQEWAKTMLMKQFDNLDFDNGPHSFTRVVLRSRLWKAAQGDDKGKREGAINTLKFMGEQGVLLALRDAKGESGELARQAYFELMNPKVVTGVTMPDSE